MEPLEESAKGNKHILVVMDHFAKWCEAFPTRDQKAQTDTKILVSKLFPDLAHPLFYILTKVVILTVY